MKKTALIVSSGLVASLLVTPALAKKLPKSALPVATDELKQLYSGNSVVWKPVNMAYFAADGSVVGVYKGGYMEGNWTVVGNEACMNVKGTDTKTKESDGKTYTDCWQYFKDGKGKYWQLWSKRYTGAKVPKDDYYQGEEKYIKPGDVVMPTYNKAKGV